MGPDDPIIKSEIQENLTSFEDRPYVLGLHAPALYFENLKKIMTQSVREKRLKRIGSSVFDYTVMRVRSTEKDGQQITELRFENAFHILCKHNFYKAFESWVNKHSNYYADGFSLSPFSMLNVTCAETFFKWLK